MNLMNQQCKPVLKGFKHAMFVLLARNGICGGALLLPQRMQWALSEASPSPATQILPITHLNCLATYCDSAWPFHSCSSNKLSTSQVLGQTSKPIFALFSLQWQVLALTSASACRPCAKALGLTCCASL